jgi:hypothetical protein
MWPIQELFSRFSSAHFFFFRKIDWFILFGSKSFLHPLKFVADRRFANTCLGVLFFSAKVHTAICTGTLFFFSDCSPMWCDTL